MQITSINNPKVKAWIKYHQKKYRDKDKCFLVEGEHLIEEAINKGYLRTLIIRIGKVNVFNCECEVYEVSDEIIERLSNNVSNVDFIGVCEQPIYSFEHFEKIIVLDDIQDPGNLGTIIRNAYSFGFDGIYVSKGCVDTYNEKVIRSTQGALFYMPIQQVDITELIPSLKEKEYMVYATALQNACGLSEYKDTLKVALIFGNEGSGVHKEIIDLCDSSIKIEMNAFESLNVAVATGICMYHFRKKQV